jgi:methyl-accepting chemotaxis protein
MIGHALIVTAGIALAGVVWWNADAERAAALGHFRAKAAAETEVSRLTAGKYFLEIYRNLRTIAMLPRVRTVDRHATNLSDEASEAIRQIYGNLATSVAVSEIYIVPATLAPKAIDPATGRPEEPIAMFDQRISGAGQAEGVDRPAEEESWEYEELARQMAWLRESRPRSTAGLDAPMLGSPELITCDNTDFARTRDDADRRGVIFTVPFYRPDGELAGGVSAIVRTKVMREALVGPGQALLNAGYGVSIVGAGTPRELDPRRSGETGGMAFASLMPMAFPDGRSVWSYWGARGWEEFERSGEVLAIERSRIGGLAFAGVVTALSLLLFGGWQRRRQARDMLRLVRLADAAVEGLVIHEQGRIVVVNRSLEVLTGRTRAELAGSPLSDLFAGTGVTSAVLAAAARHPTPAEFSGPEGPVPVEVVARLDGLDEGAAGVLAVRDLRDRRRAEHAREAHRDLRQICEEFRALITGLLGEIRDAARTMRSASGDIARLSDESTDTAGRARLAASQAIQGIGQIGMSTEELSISVGEIEGRVSSTAFLIQHGHQMSFSTRAEAERLSDAINRIASSVELIRTIAAQTNLLALNATIEAARAGEAGRGFSVVASEVKQLASQTARATDTIEAQMKEIVGTVGGAVMAVQSLAETMKTVDDRATEIAAAVEEQHAATQEIAGVVGALQDDAQAVLAEVVAAAEAAKRTQDTASSVALAASETLRTADALNEAIETFLARALAA